MYRSKSARSGYSDGSRDAEADSNETELNRLQQRFESCPSRFLSYSIFSRFRIAEGKRKASREEKELTKQKQLDEIRKLEREQNDIHKDFSLAVSKVNITRNTHTAVNPIF